MSNELLYVGIGAAAVYLFTRPRRDVSRNVSTPLVTPGVTPGTTPGIAPQPAINPATGKPYTIDDLDRNMISNQSMMDMMKGQPIGLDASGNVVFGAEGSVMVDKPAVYKVNPVDVDVMVALIQTYARNNNISPAQSYERYLDIYVNGNDTANVALVEAAWQKINSPVVKAGVGMAAVVVVAAGIYYFIANR
jgi:hypothetical protein